jgi:hypothetical protein
MENKLKIITRGEACQDVASIICRKVCEKTTLPMIIIEQSMNYSCELNLGWQCLAVFFFSFSIP